jgi:hypothetical protein
VGREGYDKDDKPYNVFLEKHTVFVNNVRNIVKTDKIKLIDLQYFGLSSKIAFIDADAFHRVSWKKTL